MLENGNRYWINKSKIVDALNDIYGGLDMSDAVRLAREFVEKRDWSVAIDITERALLEAVGNEQKEQIDTKEN